VRSPLCKRAVIIVLVVTGVLALASNSASALGPGCQLKQTCQGDEACPPRLVKDQPIVHRHRICHHIESCDNPNQNTPDLCGDCVDGACP
jgi:hypothetical protein